MCDAFKGVVAIVDGSHHGQEWWSPKGLVTKGAYVGLVVGGTKFEL